MSDVQKARPRRAAGASSPYVKLTDRARGKQLLLKPEDIESAYWLEHVSQSSEQQGDTAHNPADDAPYSRKAE